MKEQTPSCARCTFPVSERLCSPPEGHAHPGCPTGEYPGLCETALKEYETPDIHTFARMASIQEGEGYGRKNLGGDHMIPIKPRILEISEFAGKMGYKKLGLAFCMGLWKEAKIVEDVYAANGFSVTSVICKAGRASKDNLKITDDQKVEIGSDEAMCNPIFQAMVLNREHTELNIVMGLCVGHDSLFFKYADAPCTVLAAKDRLLGHNPLAAVYNIDSYYRALK